MQYLTFEKGLYATLIVKPTKRISRLLAADRELLVLFSSFEDQQPRTAALAARLIDQSEGRLEHTVAIIVHSDQAGNAKLRDWGREHGLSVIPIHVSESLPTGDALESMLFQEYFAHDAFDVSGPVSDDSRFYGRRGEAQDLARHLEMGQVRACLGIRKTGKTSIINRIVDELDKTHDCLSVMVDCSRDSVWMMDAGQLLSCLSHSIDLATGKTDSYVPVCTTKSAADLSSSADRLVESVRAAQKPVILLFDEIDYITPSSPTATHWAAHFNPFWRNLRAAHQEVTRSSATLSLFVCGVSSKWFRVDSIEGVENSALAFIPEEYLSPLPGEASAAMIRTLARTSGLQFGPLACSAVASACSHIPFWIRKACSYIHRNIPVEGRPCEVSTEDTQDLVASFIEAEGATIAEVALAHLFRVYPELVQIARGYVMTPVGEPSPALVATLARYGVVVQHEGRWALSGQMMQEGVRSALRTIDAATTQPATIASHASLSEWAEELALCGARRNLLEKKLRYLALNFLRLDSITKTPPQALSDRLLRPIEEARRKKLMHLAADDLVEKFLWTDLTRLIEKEWVLFQPMFGDKATFSRHSLVVNLRFDAHAKDADRFDIAGYRRSLDYFEEQLSKR